MKKLFTLLFVLTAFAACSDDDNGGNTAPSDFEREAQYATVFFYGNEYSEEAGTVNYYLSLSDGPLDGSGDYEWQYIIDLYANETDSEKIPAGTYTLDLDDTFANRTMCNRFSELYTPAGDSTIKFTEAQVVITNSQIVLTATTEEGKTHKVTYTGSYEIVDGRGDVGGGEGEGEGGDSSDEDFGGFASTLTGDVEVSIDSEYVIAEFYGDDYEMGYGVLCFYFEKEDYTGDSLYLEIATDGTYTGTYSPCAKWDAASTGNLIAANLYTDGDDTYTYGCWYYHSTDGDSYDEIAPIVAGSLTITANEDETCYFVFEGSDATEGGNTISFEWTGEVDYTDTTATSSAARRIYPLRGDVKVLPIAAHSQKKAATKFRK